MHKAVNQMANTTLTNAREAKQDEFYTQYYDIEREVEAYLDYNPDVFRGKTVLLPCDDPEWSNFTKYFAQNFERLGLKKLISTSYAIERKQERYGIQLSLFETEFETRAPHYDAKKTRSHGKIFILDRDENSDSRIDINDLKWQYLKGDGDFRSKEVTKLRDEADVIVTNPPFSLFREFFAWIVDTGKLFVMIANKNCVTYKELFPYIRGNRIWSGRREWAGGMWFETKYSDDVDKVVNGIDMKNVPAIWISNIDHGRRHHPLELMTMGDNLKYSKHKDLNAKNAYKRYDNYDAIEIPYTDAIPSDYNGVMGVPISFLDKYCPEQFEILNANDYRRDSTVPIKPHGLIKDKEGAIDGKPTYARILIRKRQ